MVTSQGDYYGNQQYPNYQAYQIPQSQDNMYNIPVVGQDDLGHLSPKLPYQESPGIGSGFQQPQIPFNQFPSDQNGVNLYQGYPDQQFQNPSLANQNMPLPQIGLGKGLIKSLFADQRI